MTKAETELDLLMPEISASIEGLPLGGDVALRDLCPIGWAMVQDKPGVGKAMKARVASRVITDIEVVHISYGDSGRGHTAYRKVK